MRHSCMHQGEIVGKGFDTGIVDYNLVHWKLRCRESDGGMLATSTARTDATIPLLTDNVKKAIHPFDPF